MKEMWYFVSVMLLLAVLASFADMSSPSGSFATNLPPAWDFSTSEFSTDSELRIDLANAFFDPDGDVLSFSVSPGAGVSAGLQGDTLVVFVENAGDVTITASDGQNLVSQKISVIHR
jgi:hypothetical protein